ncbi:MAG TPA: hypothetical protein VF141_07230, partial [Chryseolinea sp.]
ADGNNLKNAVEAQGVYQQALHLFPVSDSGWHPTVLLSSAITGSGIEEIWNVITKHNEHVRSTGYLLKNRSRQNIAWFHERFIQLLNKDLQEFEELRNFQTKLEAEVSSSAISSETAAKQLLKGYHEALKRKS